MSNETKEKRFEVVRETRVNSRKSLLTMAVGEVVVIGCPDFAPWSTVKSSVSRLNQQAGRTEWTCRTPDNGATIIITRQ